MFPDILGVDLMHQQVLLGYLPMKCHDERSAILGGETVAVKDPEGGTGYLLVKTRKKL